MRILVIVSLALICTRPAAANELNVIPGSTDPSPDGSLEHPFSTVYKAIAAVNAESTAIILHEGRHELATNVVVPPGIDLLILPGATLALGGRVTLAPHKLLLAEGTADKPITFTWLVPGTNWGAIGLSHPQSNGSIFRYCIVEHGDHGSHNAVNFTGAISANDVTITVSHSILRDNVGPDGINVDNVYSLIEYSAFFRHAMDPIDFDIASGDVLHCEFYDSGNDAIDLGTSHGIIAYNYIDGCVDKGISVGEGSNAFIHHNIVLNADLGIAIKDSSDPLVTHNTILHNRIGVSCYEKIFPRGGAKGTVADSIIWDSTQADVWLDAKSTTQFHHCAIQYGWPGVGNIWVGNGCDDPLFADPAAHDYHLMSRGGRWDPAVGRWVRDAVHSPCIDAGDPASDYALEPYPNGRRANIGAHGDTAEASKSFPNPDVNDDACVNVADLLTVRNNLGAGGSGINPPAADVNADGMVNVADLLIVRNALGAGGCR